MDNETLVKSLNLLIKNQLEAMQALLKRVEALEERVEKLEKKEEVKNGK